MTLPHRMTVQNIHLGGGTPNMVPVEALGQLMAQLAEAFRLSPDLVFAAELDPAVLTEDWVAAAAQLGLNRASLGVQNLDPAVQGAVNRTETFEEIAACVAWLRNAGIGSINLDLMYGLPRQSVANTLSTIDALVGLRPDRLALFGYAHVPWMKPHQSLIHEKLLPGPSERLDQAAAAAERLVGAGYIRIGLDHFALPGDDLAKAAAAGTLGRNFQGYVPGHAGPILGLGASSISSLPQGFAQNQTQDLAWRQAVAADVLPIAKGVAISHEDQLRAEVIERLMCDLTVDLRQVAARNGQPLRRLASSIAKLQPLVDDGLVEFDGVKVTVTEAGRPLVRSICAAFDTYHSPAAVRHSAAI